MYTSQLPDDTQVLEQKARHVRRGGLYDRKLRVQGATRLLQEMASTRQATPTGVLHSMERESHETCQVLQTDPLLVKILVEIIPLLLTELHQILSLVPDCSAD